METRKLNTLRFANRWGAYCRTWTPALAVFLLVATSPLAASAICGNGVLDGGEQCDPAPGNLVSGDGCTSTCTLEACGNGSVDAGETCDPSTGSSGGCGPTGNEPACNFAAAGENGSTAACDYNCTAQACADGIWNKVVETCDATASGQTHAACDLPTDTGTPGGCTPSAWADGTLNTANSEQCDDGNVTLGDGCDIHLLTACGNGYIAGAEQCDDANLASGDGCDSNCKITACGNGIVTATGGNVNPEQCDDGNFANGDGCDFSCRNEVCGNGVLNNYPPFNEQCDDLLTGPDPLPLNNGDGCSTTCRFEVCGNGILNNYAPNNEECDPAPGNVANQDGCDSNCKIERCGNGIVAQYVGATLKTCDPATGTTGNPLLAVASNGACDRDCTAPACQDSLVNPFTGEQCDDGNGLCGDGCRANCLAETCGDGLVDCGEMCDDGNTSNLDACDANCDTSVCGNGVTQPALGETCDDGNILNGDTCDSNCTLPGCGNGLALGIEACDDGNTFNNDGCDTNCTVTACGNGIKNTTEECDPPSSPTPPYGNVVSLDGCSSTCKDEYCGNGIIGSAVPEVCDDGNTILTDACPTTGSPPLGLGCKSDPDGDGTFAGDPVPGYGPFDLKNDGCQAVTYSTATVPNQQAAKPKISIGKLNTPGSQTLTMSGYFNPARTKVCENGLTTCTVNSDCSGVPGADACGIPRPNLQGVHIEVRNLLSATSSAWKPVFEIDVPGEIDTPGGEYQQRSATPACGNARDGWKVQTSTSRVTYTYNNTSGLLPNEGGVDGSCTVSAQGLRTIRLVYDLKKLQWQYSVTVRNTTLANAPSVGLDGKVSGTLQSQLALGTQVLDSGASNDPGDIGNCADAQFRGALPGGLGSVAACKGTAISVSCR